MLSTILLPYWWATGVRPAGSPFCLLLQEPRERCCNLVNCGELVGVISRAVPYWWIKVVLIFQMTNLSGERQIWSFHKYFFENWRSRGGNEVALTEGGGRERHFFCEADDWNPLFQIRTSSTLRLAPAFWYREIQKKFKEIYTFCADDNTLYTSQWLQSTSLYRRPTVIKMKRLRMEWRKISKESWSCPREESHTGKVLWKAQAAATDERDANDMFG